MNSNLSHDTWYMDGNILQGENKMKAEQLVDKATAGGTWEKSELPSISGTGSYKVTDKTQ